MVKATTDKTPVLTLSKVNLASPQSLSNFSHTLKDYIVKNELFVGIKNKNYVLVEGWQFAGACIGIFPVVKSVERIETSGTEIKYKASVDLIKLPGEKVIGSGFAIASSEEKLAGKKRWDDEYAIASMAQTRAIGKSYRNMLAWIMKLAGYEPTPAEEMGASETGEVDNTPEEPTVDVEVARKEVDAAIMTMDTPNRVRFLKTVGRMSQNTLTDEDYVKLYEFMEAQKEANPSA
jgi:hypothetical protein